MTNNTHSNDIIDAGSFLGAMDTLSFIDGVYDLCVDVFGKGFENQKFCATIFGADGEEIEVVITSVRKAVDLFEAGKLEELRGLAIAARDGRSS